MASSTESNKKNWLVQINDLNDQQIKNITEYIGSGNTVNPDLGIHHAMVAMYLGYKNRAKGTEEPKLTKNLKVMLFSIHLFFHIFNILCSNLFLFLFFN
jgi:hypothetical protein